MKILSGRDNSEKFSGEEPESSQNETSLTLSKSRPFSEIKHE